MTHFEKSSVEICLRRGSEKQVETNVDFVSSHLLDGSYDVHNLKLIPTLKIRLLHPKKSN